MAWARANALTLPLGHRADAPLTEVFALQKIQSLADFLVGLSDARQLGKKAQVVVGRHALIKTNVLRHIAKATAGLKPVVTTS